MPQDRGSRAGEVPAGLREQYEQFAARAAAAGRALDPTPVLEIATRARHDSRVFLGTAGAAGPVRVRLSRDLVTAVPAERAWTIAHELGHALRHLEGARLQTPAGLLAGSALAGTASAAGVFAAGYAALRGFGAAVDLLLTLSMVGAVVMTAGIATVTRREEVATDATAAAVFGEVLSAAGVRRLRRREGIPARLLPSLLRSHPHRLSSSGRPRRHRHDEHRGSVKRVSRRERKRWPARREARLRAPRVATHPGR